MEPTNEVYRGNQWKTTPIKTRFDSKWKENIITGCWEWLAYRDKNGYGNFSIGTTPRQAHRVAYELYKGSIGDLQVLHSCDNPSCVNPEHLWLGTPLENMQDKVKKGRLKWGCSYGKRTLS